MVRAHSASLTEFRLFRGGEKLVRLLKRALQPARANVILPAFHQRRLELDRQDFLQDRDVLLDQLFLQIDRVRRDDRFLLLLDREKRRGHEVSERFADAGAGFDHEMPLLLERARDRGRHLLLLRAKFEIARLREQPVLRENRPHPLDKVAPERIFERNHFARSLREKFESARMRLLDRYIVRNFLQPYVYCILGFLSIWLIFDISDNSAQIFDARTPLAAVLRFYAGQIPQVLVILLPVSLLLALLFSLGRMSRANEIVSMLTAGVSVPRVTLPLLLIGLLTTGVTLALNYSLAAHAELARERLFSMKSTAAGRAISSSMVRSFAIEPTIAPGSSRTFGRARIDFNGVQIVQQDEDQNIVAIILRATSSTIPHKKPGGSRMRKWSTTTRREISRTRKCRPT